MILSIDLVDAGLHILHYWQDKADTMAIEDFGCESTRYCMDRMDSELEKLAISHNCSPEVLLKAMRQRGADC